MGPLDSWERVKEAICVRARRYRDHAAVCSCWMCGNPRRHFGDVTRQEALARNNTQEQLEEIRRFDRSDSTCDQW